MSSKEKGNRFERQVADKLSNWWGGKFNRTPQSGGASWAEQNNAVGDIVPPPNMGFPLVIECKDREGWTIDNVLLNNKEPHDWWKQVVGDASKSNLVPCLVFKRKYSQIYVALPYIEEVYDDFRENGSPIMRTDFIIDNIRKDKLYYDVMVFTLESMMEKSPYYIIEHFKNLDWGIYKKEESNMSNQSIEDGTIDDMLKNL